MKTTMLCLASLATLVLPLGPAAASPEECVSPIREEREYVPGYYVVAYHYANGNYYFVYKETNNVTGAQTHFDVGAGCSAGPIDEVVWGTGSSSYPKVPLP